MFSTEKRLLKDQEHAHIYNGQIESLLDRKAARTVTEQELAQYQGPVYYISHFGVRNEHSKSTPYRLVFNSSAKFRGNSLNDFLAKGPSLLNKLIGILIRFREGKHAFIGDVAKMYHAIDIPLRDQMTHLFLWRNLQLDQASQTYAMTAVNMGDKPSATIAQIALRKTAEEADESHPIAARIIIKKSYMDDIPASTSSVEESDRLTEEIGEILLKRGFKIKEWIFSGCNDAKPIAMGEENQTKDESSKERVLGIQWDPKNDTLEYPFNCRLTTTAITKRMMFSIINKIYDPPGLLTPFTANLKMLMRRVWGSKKKVDWDDQVPEDIQIDWDRLITAMKETEKLVFRRSITPIDAVGKPILAVFSDGSEDAFGTAAYIRWKTEKGFSSELFAAKSRLAPLQVINIVRLELCGAVLGTRLRATIEKELELEFEKVFHFTDSEIVKAMINRESYGFNSFAENRIREIQTASNKEEWRWIPGKPYINVSDLTTRGVDPADLNSCL